MSGINITTQLSVFILVPMAVAALFTYLSTRVASSTASENAKWQLDLTSRVKLADFRQEWINDLRDSLAELQSCALTTTHSEADMPRIYRLSAKIHLLMNREDKRYAELSAMLMAVISNAHESGRATAVQKLTTLAQEILKTEWEVLKHDLRYEASAINK